MSLSKAVKDLSGIGDGGRKQYKKLLAEHVADRVEEHDQLVQSWKDTVKTMNGLSQLASQQVQQIENLTKQIADLAKKQTETNDGDSEETEEKGE
jgi:hypothetical protein